MSQLKTLLLKNAAGPIPPAQVPLIEELLSMEWHSFHGSREGGMVAEKLFRRTEDMGWNPPFLTFQIERHGGTVNGSTRAELQVWQIDLSASTAEIIARKRRQLHSVAKRVFVNKDAQRVAKLILDQKESPLLKRLPDGRVKVLINKVVPPDGFKQTISGRRKRFRACLEKLIAEQGWEQTSYNVYKHAPKV